MANTLSIGFDVRGWSQIPHRRNDTGHGTEKPLERMKWPIQNNSRPGQAIFDPFCGSETTIIAAEITGRVCHAIELNPIYVDVAVKRWQAFTGEKAKLDGDERPFAEVSAERLETQSGEPTTESLPIVVRGVGAR